MLGLSFRKKYVFYHIPKTGGTTLQVWLDQFFDVDEICPRTFFKPNALRTSELTADQKRNIRQYRFIRDHFFINIAGKLRGRVKTFTMLRDPARRVLSQFHYYRNYSDADIELNLRRGTMLPEHARAIQNLKNISFFDFLKQGPGVLSPDFHNTQAVMIAGSLTRKKQVDVTDSQGVLKDAWRHLRRMNFFGLLEMFEPSIQLLCFSLNFRYTPNLYPLNRQSYADQTDFLNEEHKKLLAPWIDLDRKLYVLAQKEFMLRYRRMVVCVLKKAGWKRKELSEAVRSPFSSGVQEAVVLGLQQKDSSRIASLLRNHRHLYCRKKTDCVSLSMEKCLIGEGWFEREGFADNQTLCRWSGPGLVSDCWIRIIPGQAYLLSGVILEVLKPEILEGLKLFAGSAELDLQKEMLSLNSARIKGVVPASAAGDRGLLRIQFKVPLTVSHHQFCGAADKRRKGIRVSEINLVPIQELNRSRVHP